MSLWWLDWTFIVSFVSIVGTTVLLALGAGAPKNRGPYR